MTESEPLARIATTLRTDIGAAIEGEYPKTQVFMAAVLLQKLALQLAQADDDHVAARADIDALIEYLQPSLRSMPEALAVAARDLTRVRGNATLCRYIEALYAARPQLVTSDFDTLLTQLRRVLRADLDRRLRYCA